MKEFWNERYGEEDYVYGEQPNVFLAEQLSFLPRGKIILPCEGEGRNAVFAAELGWETFAFDQSEAGKLKSDALANKRGVSIQYIIQDALEVKYEANTFDVVAFIFAHFPAAIRQQIHRRAVKWLKPGGRIILEAFHPNQLNFQSGGPKELSMLYTPSMLQDDFKSLSVEYQETTETTLSEGKYHEGKASVTRFVGVKNQINE